MSLFSDSEITDWEGQAEKRLGDALNSTRDVKLTKRCNTGHTGNEKPLSITSLRNRLKWAKVVCSELEEFFQYDNETKLIAQDAYFITLVDQKCVIGINDDLDLNKTKKILRRGLRRLNYFGRIEPAYYGCVTPEGTTTKLSQCISWHSHVLVWGIEEQELKARIKQLNASGLYVPMTDRQFGVVGNKIRPGTLSDVVAYMLKPPAKKYSLGRSDIRRNGDIVKRVIQYKGDLRPKDLLTLYVHMQHHCADEVMMAGGEGSDILKRARKIALAPFRRRWN